MARNRLRATVLGAIEHLARSLHEPVALLVLGKPNIDIVDRFADSRQPAFEIRTAQGWVQQRIHGGFHSIIDGSMIACGAGDLPRIRLSLCDSSANVAAAKMTNTPSTF